MVNTKLSSRFFNKGSQGTISSKLLNAREVATWLGVDVWTVRRWTSMRKIPFLKLSARCVRYDPVRIAEWTQKHAVEMTKQTDSHTVSPISSVAPGS
jgi:hypothetical protein